MHVTKMKNQTFLFLAFLTLFPFMVLSDCTCNDEQEDRNRSLALRYKSGAIASILVGSLIGVCLPIWGKKIPCLSPEKNFFFIIKAFAAGVILATGFIHVLPDAFASLTCPCLPKHPWGNFSFTGFIAMLATIATLMVDVYATTHYRKKSGNERIQAAVGNEAFDMENNFSGVSPLHTLFTQGHAHASLSIGGDSISTQHRYRVISQVLELGIIVHSVIIGIALGASDSPKTVRPLLAALTFHQFFEGIGLGGCITQARFNALEIAIMAFFFSLTTPVGIAIGIGIAKFYDENSPKALIVQGIFDAASAGILIYMALVDLLSADFMNPKMQSNGKLQLGANVSLLLGAGCMSFLAIWA